MHELIFWIIIAIIGGGLLALVIFIYQKTQNMFWIYAWLGGGSFGKRNRALQQEPYQSGANYFADTNRNCVVYFFPFYR